MIMGERILLVEGDDDRHVLWNLFMVREVPKRFKIKHPGSRPQSVEEESAGGDTVLLESIRGWLVRSDLDCLAVILDADDKGPDARWQSVRQRLINAGCEVGGMPERHNENGVVFDLSLEPQTPRAIRFAAWFMPDNRSLGMIEDFVGRLIREDDAMMSRVDGFLDSIPRAERRFSPAHLAKARIHSWLAVSERPGRPMGQAIANDKHIDATHPSVQPFLDWVKKALLD
jgi:hypothetical protein